jgi:hypothetical protein
LIAYYEAVAAHASRDTICFINGSRHMSSTQCGITPKAIREGQAGQDDQGTFSGVVPDGVAAVTLNVPASGGHPAHSVTASVNGNVFAARAGSSAASLAPKTVIWRSAEGRVLKRISPPTAAGGASACARYPLACLVVQDAYTEDSSATSSARAR